MDYWTKQIRSDEILSKIPSAALLMFKEEETYFRSHFLPVDCYIIKPIDFTEMDTITHALKYFVENIPAVKDDQVRKS